METQIKTGDCLEVLQSYSNDFFDLITHRHLYYAELPGPFLKNINYNCGERGHNP